MGKMWAVWKFFERFAACGSENASTHASKASSLPVSLYKACAPLYNEGEGKGGHALAAYLPLRRLCLSVSMPHRPSSSVMDAGYYVNPRENADWEWLSKKHATWSNVALKSENSQKSEYSLHSLDKGEFLVYNKSNILWGCRYDIWNRKYWI